MLLILFSLYGDTMYALAEFPSQGDLIKFTYDALGIIPCKSEQILDLKIENKSLQRSLQRLANEDSSNFLENLDTHIQALIQVITDLFPSYQLQNSLLDTLKEVFQCYLGTILDNHTYLEKKKSFEFIIFSTLLPRLPISILKHKESYADYFKKSHTPKDLYWFLGSEDLSPLSYIMQWIYNSENLAHEEFHTLLPSQLKNKEDNQDEKDIWNTQKWLNNQSLPALSNIKAVFTRAFVSHSISLEKQETYLFFLTIARFCTYCIQEIKEIYGLETLGIIVTKLRLYTSAIYKDYFIFKNKVKQAISRQKDLLEKDPYSIEQNTNVDEMINFAVFESFSTNCLQAGEELALHVQRVGHTRDLPDSDDTFPANFNLITLKDGFTYLQVQADSEQFLTNIENYHHGYFDVLNKKISFEVWLKEYRNCQNHIVYPWLEQWIRGVLALKKDQLVEALDFMDKAFTTIRYSAGKHQERFLEDYLLVSLANSKGYKSFKQAYKWGRFMNHFGGLKPVFNLTSDEDIKQFYQTKKSNFKAFEKSKNNMDMRTLAKLVLHWKYDSD